MQLNFTFFLQIFNFAITYWFLNKYMFKPVISYIKKRQKEENKIKENIEKKELFLIKLEEKKDKELETFKEDMNKKYKVEPIKEPDISSKVSSEVDAQEAKEITKVAKKILVERVPNVD